MKLLNEDTINSIDQRAMGITVLIFGILSGVGSAFKIKALEDWTSDPRVLIPVVALFLYFGIRSSMESSEDLKFLRRAHSPLVFQQDIEKTHGSMWDRAKANGTRMVWATYLNPDAFRGGDVDSALKKFYEQAESYDGMDYRRVFGIYPSRRGHDTGRRETIEWLRGHLERTKGLRHYEARFVEIEFQAAEMWIDDFGINFSFPSAPAREAGWATVDLDAQQMAKDYFLQLWGRARPVKQLFG